MTDVPLILGIDTSGPYCAAALLRGDVVLDIRAEEMARGQAERLMDLLQEVLSAQNLVWSDLNALAVGTGPGNFTGIRIGVSAVRGLALGLAIPAYGVTGFEAGKRLAPTGSTVAIPAPRDMAYVDGTDGPQLIPMADVAKPAPTPTPAALARAIAQHAITLWPTPCPPPAPFYIRPPDAAPARDSPPRVLS